MLLIPSVVLQELDGLKGQLKGANEKKEGLGYLARQATSWLLSTIDGSAEETVVIRGQRKKETLIVANLLDRGLAKDNDGLILDACLYFRERSQRVVLVTNDNNLALRVRFEEMEMIKFEGQDATALLQQIISGEAAAPPLLSSPSPTRVRSQHLPATSTSPTQPQRLPSATKPRLPPRSPFRPPPPPAIALPHERKRIINLAAFYLDPLPLPPLPEPTTPFAIFNKVVILFAHFVALPLYKYLLLRTEYLDEEAAVARVHELGDWRKHNIVDCLGIMKRYWIEGEIEELCRIGLEKCERGSREEEEQRRIRRSSSASSSIASSQWATEGGTTLASASELKINATLKELHRSIPILLATLTTAHSPQLWSAARFDIFLEELGCLLRAVLSATSAGEEGVARQVNAMMKLFATELILVGLTGIDLKGFD